jgi:hypothetical protein
LKHRCIFLSAAGPDEVLLPPQEAGTCMQVEGLDTVTVVGIAFAAFIIGVLLTTALWYIHTHTGGRHSNLRTYIEGAVRHTVLSLSLSLSLLLFSLDGSGVFEFKFCYLYHMKYRLSIIL